MSRIAAILTACAIAGGCSGGADAVVLPEDLSGVDTSTTVPQTITTLPLATYDGSGQVVHPDYLAPVLPWSYRPKFLAATPYPFSNQRLENPTLYSGIDGMRWTVAPGTPNPIVTPRTGFLSDPDIVYANLRNEIFLYYRQSSDSDRVLLSQSENGVNWKESTQLLSGRPFSLLSPAVVRRTAGDWLMWTVNAAGGCDGPSARVELRRSSDGIGWSQPEPVTLDFGTAFPWHIDVQYLWSRREFWALVPTKVAGSCMTAELRIARSTNGVNWEVLPNPVARAGEFAQFRDIIYRSTFSYDYSSDNVTLWLSGARFSEGNFVWSTAAVRRPRAWLFDRVARAQVTEPAPRRALLDSLFVPPH